MNRVLPKKVLIIVIIVGIILLVGSFLAYQYVWSPNKEAKTQKGLTQNNTGDEYAGWETYKSETDHVELRYPETFSGAVWNDENWPPTVKVLNSSDDPIKDCGENIYAPGQVVPRESKTINNLTYTIYEGSDVGAGNLYSDHCYVLNKDDKYYVVDFVIHSINGCGNGNCGPVCGTNRENACKNFDMIKEIEQPIENIVSTLRFLQ